MALLFFVWVLAAGEQSAILGRAAADIADWRKKRGRRSDPISFCCGRRSLAAAAAARMDTFALLGSAQAAASAHLDELNRAHATISCNIPPDDATRIDLISQLNALYARAIELARAERLAASRARTACAHAAASTVGSADASAAASIARRSSSRRESASSIRGATLALGDNATRCTSLLVPWRWARDTAISSEPPSRNPCDRG